MKCFSTCHSDPSCIVLSNFSISRPIPLVFSRLPAKARIKDKYMIQLNFKHHIMPKLVSNRRSLPAFLLQVQTGLGCLILAEHRPPYSAVNLPHTFEQPGQSNALQLVLLSLRDITLATACIHTRFSTSAMIGCLSCSLFSFKVKNSPVKFSAREAWILR